MQGLIIKIISGDYFVKVNEETIKCKPLGVFRHKKVTPKVGDIVEVEDNTITKIKILLITLVILEKIYYTNVW